VSVPTIEHDDHGWWVRLVCPDGIERRVGPMTKGAAWWFAARNGGAT
jgi:hypothetical protein